MRPLVFHTQDFPQLSPAHLLSQVCMSRVWPLVGRWKAHSSERHCLKADSPVYLLCHVSSKRKSWAAEQYANSLEPVSKHNHPTASDWRACLTHARSVCRFEFISHGFQDQISVTRAWDALGPDIGVSVLGCASIVRCVGLGPDRKSVV